MEYFRSINFLSLRHRVFKTNSDVRACDDAAACVCVRATVARDHARMPNTRLRVLSHCVATGRAAEDDDAGRGTDVEEVDVLPANAEEWYKRAAVLAGASDHIVLPVTHLSMLWSREAAEQVVAYLRTGRFDRG